MVSLMYFLCAGLLTSGLVQGSATIKDCGGPQKSLTVTDGSVLPDPIQYPGNISMTVGMKVLKDLPATNLELKLSLLKLEPYKMPVPCFEGIGSCTYDVCEMIENHKSQLCPMFPDPDECGCPMKVGSYFVKDALVPLPDFGEEFADVLKGNYEGNMTFIDTATNTELGCIALTFEIVKSS